MSTGVAFYGKVRIPTIGHAKAIEHARKISKKVGGKLSIGLSGAAQPLSIPDKKRLAEKLFSHPVEVGEEHTKSLTTYLQHLGKKHDELHLVAGSDRVPEYRNFLERYNNKPDRSGKVLFNFKKWQVHEVPGERIESTKNPTNMSRDELEKTVSASELEKLAKEGNYEHFKAYHPGIPDSHVRRIFSQIRKSGTITEDIDHKKFGPMLDSFVSFASDKLGLDQKPNIQFVKGEGNSFGGYNPQSQQIIVVTKDRHPMDIFRTVAHELVHHKQNGEGRIQDVEREGSTGSDIENEANAEAGKLMRWYAKTNPKAFTLSYVTEETIEEGLNDPAIFKAVILAGGPGSGKDYILKQTLSGHGLTEINSDDAFEYLMKKRGLSMTMPKREEVPREVARAGAKEIAGKKKSLAIHGRRGVIINGTAADPEKIARLKSEMENIGYDTKMLFVNTSDDVSKQRNIERGMRGGRKVREELRKEKWQQSQQARPAFQNLFGPEHYHEIDNSADLRTASPEVQKRSMDNFQRIHKEIRRFTREPPNKISAQNWIRSEAEKRGVTNYKPARSQSPISEDLRKWFREKWVRFDTKGNIKGPCAREPGEGKPKCRPLSAAQSMTKDERAKSARRKRREDPVANRSGKGNKPIFVATEQYLREKNEPTNPELWSKAKALAKQKFDVYPSAYANGWASKWYKEKGGGWKSVNESEKNVYMSKVSEKNISKKGKVRRKLLGKTMDEKFSIFAEEHGAGDFGTTELADNYKMNTPGQEMTVSKKKKKLEKESVGFGPIKPFPYGYEMSSSEGPGPTFGVVRSPSGLGGGYSIPLAEEFLPENEKIRNWALSESTQKRFFEKYSDSAAEKLIEVAYKLDSISIENVSGAKSVSAIKESFDKGIMDISGLYSGRGGVYGDSVTETIPETPKAKYKVKRKAKKISETYDVELKYHLDRNILISENVYRYGSKNYFELINEARRLVDEGKIELSDIDKNFLKTDIGTFAEYHGQEVPLDMPMLYEEEEKTPELNKPKRGGPKKFYVYVRDPSTNNIKKVTFGDTTGLSVKMNDPEARKSFAARHGCGTERASDKTKAAYWACNLPRYAKSLGMSGGGSFYW